MTDIEQQHRIEIFVGIDVGKGAHHTVALDLTGRRLLDSALPNDEAKLRARITKLKEHGRVLLVVDQPATIQTSNRIRGLLTQIHPALERVIGPHLDHPAILDLIERGLHLLDSHPSVRSTWPTGSSNWPAYGQALGS